MKISMLIPLSLLMAILLLVDFYIFRGFSGAVPRSLSRFNSLIKWLYWAVPLVVCLWLGYVMQVGAFGANGYPRFMFLVAFIVLFYLPKFVFVIFQAGNDLLQVGAWVVSKLSGPATSETALGVSRSKFLLQLGVIISAVPFVGVVHGVVRGRFNFRVVRQKLTFPNFPVAFNGFKMLQISDAHLGSFIGSEEKIEKAVELINDQHADIVVFTGDIVNSFPEELETFTSIFAKISAKEGKYAILGNHDYGFHGPITEGHDPRQNVAQIKLAYHKMGFQLLLNEHVTFTKSGESFSLLGVENWGRPPFPQLGNLDKARHGAMQSPFSILLSHDPSHWEELVKEKTNIDLTLSGHTHGMQFGIKVGNWQWSPVSMKYPRWGGLYQEGKQYLYVNRGFGVLAFPGRIGMDPELTVFELSNASS